MRNAYWLVMTVALVVVMVAPAGAQTARSLAMGNAGVGVADDSVAWSQNPAGLPYLQPAPITLSPFPSHISGTIDLDSDVDTLGLNYSARLKGRTAGWGIGYWKMDMGNSDTDNLGAGYGMPFGQRGMSWGVALRRVETTSSGSQVEQVSSTSNDKFVGDIGVMFRQSLPVSDLKVGLVARDVTDQFQSTFDLGASVDLPAGVLVAADIVDITDEADTQFNIGAEWKPPLLSAVVVRGGLADGDVTLGAGYDLGMIQVSLSWQDLDADSLTSATVSAVF